MRAETLEVVADWYRDHLYARRDTLELGAMEVYGGTASKYWRADPVRHHYMGVDMRAGPGVDMVANAHDLPWPDDTWDVVLCFDMLEHDSAFWLTMREIYRVLRPGGLLALSVPTINYATYHPHPEDYWRFTHSGVHELLRGFLLVDYREICTDPPTVDTVAALVRKPE